MKKTLALILTFIMVLALVPTVAFAETYVAWIDGTGYETLEAAVNAAKSGDTIMLGEGEYTLYNISSGNTTKNKDLTFIGKGEKTIWQIGSETPDPAKEKGEGNGDYSFDGAGTVTFKKMTLRAPLKDSGKGWNYLGFIRADKTIVEDCTMFGKTFFWGYTSATFTNTTFNCPAGDYAVWTYCSPTMSFYNCTFNSSGKVINVYTDYSAGKHNITVNFENCTVNNEEGTSLKPVLNINDYNMGNYKYILKITGDNNVTGVDVDKITCSRLFGFGGEEEKNTGRSDVTINGVKVWEKGKRVCPHNGFVFGEGSYNGDVATQYTDGYKDDAFTVTPNDDGSFDVTCDYCGYTETSTNGLYNDIKLERTVNVTQNSNSVLKDTADPNKYKVANSRNIAVDYTATMDMRELVLQVGDTKYSQENKYTYNNLPHPVSVSPWELLKILASTRNIDGTKVILTFKFDNIDLKAFKDKYDAGQNVLELTSDMFKMTDVAFGPDNTMTIKCNWNMETDPDTLNPIITLKGFGLPVKDNWGGSEIDIKNSGCVSGTVHIKKPRTEAAVAMVEPVLNVAANQESIPTPSLDTIQIPIVGGCADDKFTLYYGGGSSDDSSGDSGHSHYNPTPTPVPVIVIPPKTGDMTVWQSILHFLGIR